MAQNMVTRLTLRSVAVAAASVVSMVPALAIPVSWVGPANGLWDVAGNWSPGLPGAADDALLGAFNTTFQTGTATVRSFTGTGTFTMSGGTLSFSNLSSIGGWLMSGGQLGGAGNLTVTGTAVIGAGGLSGGGTSTLQGATTLSNSELRLDGGRVLRNEGTLTQAGGDININAQRIGVAQAGNGSVLNAAGASWTSSLASGTNYILAGNQGAGDTGAGATFTNAGTFSKQGAGVTEVRTSLVNNGTLEVAAGTLRLASGGALTHNGNLTVAAGAVLNFDSGASVSHVFNTASTTLAGTLSITGDNLLNFNAAHTIGGSGSFQHNYGQVTGADLTFGPQLSVRILDGGHSGAATTTLQGNTILVNGGTLKLDGGRVLRNEGTFTQVGDADLNSRRSGPVQAGNGSVLNAAGASWVSSLASGTNYILATNQGAGDTGAGATFTNAGTFSKQGAGATEVRTAFNNTGLIDAKAGAMRFTAGTQGSGTLQTSGGVVDLQAASTTGRLVHGGNAVNSLQLGANTLMITADYDNAGFGVGNTFNRRANVAVTGAGHRLIAAGDANQGLSGVGVSNGSSTTPSLLIGNVHVGATVFNYTIDNTGSSGPSLRGAIQTIVNGASLTDTRLSGSGVAAGNWGPLATSASLARDVVLTLDTAGVYAPLASQSVAIVNNFDNTRSQLLAISSASGAAAFNLAAAAAVTPNPVVLANQRVGGVALVALTMQNTAPAGSFTEGLDASFGALTGAAVTNGAAISLLAGGASNSSRLAVGVDTGVAGARSGTVALNLQSNGSASSGLGITALAPQLVNVSGQVFRLASASVVAPNPVVLSAQRVGGALEQSLTLGNIAANDGYSERLNASIAADGAATAAGAISLLGAGASSNQLRVAVDTRTAGSKTGTATVSLVSDGTGTSGLGSLGLGTQSVSVSGQVYAPAAARLNTSALNFGIVHVGDTVANRAVSVSNTAVVAGLNDLLLGTLSGAGVPFSSGGTLGAGLAAGGTDATGLQVALDTSTAGVYSNSAQVLFASHNAEMADLDLGSQGLTLAAQVNHYASAAFAKTSGQGNFNAGAVYTLDFGTLTTGDAALSAQLAVLNTAIGPADALRGAFDLGNTGTGDNFVLSGFGTFGEVAAGDSFSGLQIGFGSGLLGSFDKVVVLRSFGFNASGYDVALGDVELRLRGNVVAVPEPGTYLLMAGGLLTLWLARRRTRRAV